jgi:hypothetical protein
MELRNEETELLDGSSHMIVSAKKNIHVHTIIMFWLVISHHSKNL